MRKRILRGAAILGVLAVPFGAATASGAFLAGTYAGKITGVQGISLPSTAGNMKLKINGNAHVTSFQFSKVLVACADGNVYRTSAHWSKQGGVPIYKGPPPHFTLTGSTGTATLKAKGIIRGHDHARGYLNFKGLMNTSGGRLNCKTGKQFWSAKHVR